MQVLACGPSEDIREGPALSLLLYGSPLACGSITPSLHAIRNLDSILKSRDITLPTKVHLIKAMVFPVVMYGCESWTIKKGERRRIDAFELWCWRRLLRVPWTARRSNQPILKETSPGCSLEGLMLKLKLQYSGHLMRRTDSLEKTLRLGKIWRQEEKGTTVDEMGWMASPTQWTWVWVNLEVGDGQGGLACCSPWGHKESDTTEQLNWAASIFLLKCTSDLVTSLLKILQWLHIDLLDKVPSLSTDQPFLLLDPDYLPSLSLNPNSDVRNTRWFFEGCIFFVPFRKAALSMQEPLCQVGKKYPIREDELR